VNKSYVPLKTDAYVFGGLRSLGVFVWTLLTAKACVLIVSNLL
jgi:hypothetical protein